MMKTLEVTITVQPDGTAELLPAPPLAPGTHHGVLVLEAPQIRDEVSPVGASELVMLDWSAWPMECRFSREDIYGDDDP